jgi:hypothetical protein
MLGSSASLAAPVVAGLRERGVLRPAPEIASCARCPLVVSQRSSANLLAALESVLAGGAVAPA